MKPRLHPLDGQAHRIGDRLVGAGDTELAGSNAVRLRCERNGIADAKAFCCRELSCDEDCGQLLGLRRGVQRGPGNQGDCHEREQAGAHLGSIWP